MRMLIAAVALACLLGACGDKAVPSPAAGATVATGAIQPLGRTVETFGDWVVTCNRALHCEAIGPTADKTAVGVHIYRDAGPDAQPGAMLTFGLADSAAYSTVTANVGGNRFATSSPTSITDGVANVEDDAVPGLARALAAGGPATLTRADQPPITISTEGASAALRWMDERQGRTGTVTALVDPGDRPASAVPAAPQVQTPQAAPAADQAGLEVDALIEAVTARLRARSDVQTCGALDGAAGGVWGYRLNAATELWGIGCNSGTANDTRLWFLTGPNGADPQPLILPLTDDVVTEFDGSEFNPDQQTLSISSLAPSQCGVRAQWVWTGAAFALQSENAMSECWNLEPDMWPSTW
ncbi:DUF1176 domain-containing protein [Brevundimonas sp.]|uniref:DUF1176 domain-containing protein n=1 Tax=Brevundimonas sp. TaxID=1871086 RepID=UPI00286C759B|nr:DUF1176 domain-containing protein [Brevundimonas sp.]